MSTIKFRKGYSKFMIPIALLSVAWPTRVKLVFFFFFFFFFFFYFAPELVGYSAPRDLHRRAAYSIYESLFLIHQDVNHDLFVCSW